MKKVPFGEGVVLSDIGVRLLYVFAVSSMSVYAVLMSGWSSNSKYAFLGAMRAAFFCLLVVVVVVFRLLFLFTVQIIIKARLANMKKSVRLYHQGECD